MSAIKGASRNQTLLSSLRNVFERANDEISGEIYKPGVKINATVIRVVDGEFGAGGLQKCSRGM